MEQENGTKNVTIAEIARRAGVSSATVSYVISPPKAALQKAGHHRRHRARGGRLHGDRLLYRKRQNGRQDRRGDAQEGIADLQPAPIHALPRRAAAGGKAQRPRGDLRPARRRVGCEILCAPAGIAGGSVPQRVRLCPSLLRRRAGGADAGKPRGDLLHRLNGRRILCLEGKLLRSHRRRRYDGGRPALF